MDYKLNRLIQSAYDAYTSSQQSRLNVPIDMAQFALKEKVSPQVTTYLCAQFLFSGKARTEDRPARTIAEHLDITERTVYRHFEWLQQRNWIGKDGRNGWYWFRGIDFIRKVEGFTHRRSAKMLESDLRTAKDFFTGAVVNSICKTRKARTERKQGRSQQSYIPIALATLEKVFSISKKTAFTYRKNSAGKYYTMTQNLRRVATVEPEGMAGKVSQIKYADIHALKRSGIDGIRLRLFGSHDTVVAKPEQLRKQYGRIYVQLANLIKPTMLMTKRTH